MAVSAAEGARQSRKQRDRGSYPHLPVEASDPLGDGPLTIRLPRVYRMRHLLSENGTTTAPTVEKSFWEEVADFYSDNNNMAMYCVLPILVLVYGGCSAIYCIHKCRRYIRRRRHKRKHPDTESLVAEDERNDLNQEGGESLSGSERQPIKTVSANNNWGESTATFADVNGYNVQRKKTPLPWNAPEEVLKKPLER
ncbi:hypothetical protein ACOMHN_024102 [Nucella lapillus]